MNKKEITMFKKLYAIKYAKWVCYRELYEPNTQMYTEGYSEYSTIHNLMLELGFNEFDLYEFEKTAPDFTRYLRHETKDARSDFNSDMFKYGYM